MFFRFVLFVEMKSYAIVFVLIFCFRSFKTEDLEWPVSQYFRKFPLEQPWAIVKRNVKHEICYSYENETGPENWPSMFQECGGLKQSPINIKTCEAKNLTVKKPLQWSSTYFVLPETMYLIDTGHTLELQVTYCNDEHPQLSRGPLCDAYVFKHLQFHWSACGTKGSEHSIDGQYYPMEMHIVHEKECTSKGKGNKFVIVAFFFQVGDEGSKGLDRLLQVMNKAVKNPHKKIKLKRYFNLCDLFQPFTCDYLTYDGSFTSPPCTEGVTWLINPYPLTISKKQMDRFRAASTADLDLKNNFRPCQPLHGRTVHVVT